MSQTEACEEAVFHVIHLYSFPCVGVGNPSEKQLTVQEPSQVDSLSGGSLVVIKPQDVVTEDTNPIGSSLCSVQTVETNSGTCETEGKTPPATVIKQNKSNRFVLPADDDGTGDIDGPSHVFQETFYPLLGVIAANGNNSVMISQKAENKDDFPVGHQSLPQEESVDQDEHENVHFTDQHKHLLACDVPPVDTDIQSINQEEESVDREQQSLDQDSEDNDNPFSHLLLFSDDDTDSKPLKASKKKQWRKAKSKPPNDGRRKTERITPDSFIAVRFSSPELRHKLGVVQQHMIEIDKKLKPTLIPLVKLHVTLMTLRLNNNTSLIEKWVTEWLESNVL